VDGDFGGGRTWGTVAHFVGEWTRLLLTEFPARFVPDVGVAVDWGRAGIQEASSYVVRADGSIYS